MAESAGDLHPGTVVIKSNQKEMAKSAEICPSHWSCLPCIHRDDDDRSAGRRERTGGQGRDAAAVRGGSALVERHRAVLEVLADPRRIAHAGVLRQALTGSVTSSVSSALARRFATRLTWRLVVGCIAGALKRMESFGQGVRQRYLPVQPGEAEQAAGLAAAADYTQAGAVRGSTPGHADECAEPGGVHEADLLQVGDDRLAALRQHDQALLQLSYGRDVDLTGHCGDYISWFVLDLDGQLRVHDRFPSAAHPLTRRRSRLPGHRASSVVTPASLRCRACSYLSAGFHASPGCPVVQIRLREARSIGLYSRP